MDLENMNEVVKRISRFFCYVGATWIFLLMLLISIDVFCRVFLNSPLRGIPEISMNSVASIAFLMLPWAIYEGSNVRSTVLLDKFPESKKWIIDIPSLIIGSILFLGIIVSGWKPMIMAIRILEYEGEGALRVPTYPVRIIIVIASFLSFLQCLMGLISYIKQLKKNRQNRLTRSARRDH